VCGCVLRLAGLQRVEPSRHGGLAICEEDDQGAAEELRLQGRCEHGKEDIRAFLVEELP
jgi:hypothetical protein